MPMSRWAIAALLLLPALPAVAQEEEDGDSVVVETEVTAKRPVKTLKSYPMMEIKGKVVDASTGEGIGGVQLKSFNNAYYTAMTDEDGTYTISVPTFVTSITAVLEGYNLVQVPLNGRSEDVDIKLYSSKYSADYAAKITPQQSVGAEGFEHTTAISVDQEIQNRLGADVRGISRSAIPGQGVQMFINGLHSINANSQPLFVIDGVIQDVMYNKEMMHEGYFDNMLANISMDDIERVRVLKNGTAIYGAKGANGVILIDTKRNKSMATRIDANLSVGVELLPKFVDVMNASEYRNYASEMLGTTGTKLTEFKFLHSKYSDNGTPYYYYNMYHNDTDWKDLVYDEALTQNYSIHIQGGDEVANYNLSVGYANAQSTLKKNDFNRFNIRFNTDILLNQWFTTRFDASFANVTRDLRDDGFSANYQTQTVKSPSMLAMVKSPFLSPYAFSTDGKVSNFIAAADDYLNEVLGPNASLANPKGILNNGEAKNKNNMNNNMINIAIAPKWQPTKNFSITERFSYTMNNYDEAYYTPVGGMPSYNLNGYGVVQNEKGSFFTKHNAIFSDTRAEWAIPLGAHRIDVFGGVRYLDDSYSETGGKSYLEPGAGNDKTPNTVNPKYQDIIGLDDSWNSMSYYANVDYNYKETYYLQGSMAVEASSRFGKDAKGLRLFGVPWAVFPSIQGAWVMSNEPWFKASDVVNRLKLNVGYELNGNDDIDVNATRTYMMASQMLKTMGVIGLENVGNTKLKWETTGKLSAGLDMNLLQNRLNLRFNYYHAVTKNLITPSTLYYPAGLKNYWTNDGKMTNDGFDVAFTAKVIDLPKFKMELGASAGHYTNKVKRLADGQEFTTTDLYNGTIITKVGKAAGLFYGYKTNGVFSTTEEAEKANLRIVDGAGNETAFQAGDMKFVDLNGDGIISDDKDRTIIGDPNPDIFGNIFANFFIGKHWSVGLNFNYSLGNDIYNYERSVLEGGKAFMNQTTAMNNRWIAEGDNTKIPRAIYGDPRGNSRFSDRWIEDGSYLKLKTLQLSYEIPMQSEFVRGITVWAAANNLLTFTKYLGSDPEATAGNSVFLQGIDRGNLAPGRSFTLGVKINL